MSFFSTPPSSVNLSQSSIPLDPKQESNALPSKSFYTNPKKCLFCPKLTSFPQTFQMLNKALFLKYSSSQNYYYTKDIQELIDNTRKPHVISFKDNILLEEDEEYLTRMYKQSEHKAKVNYLTEYYKYHKEVPRLFMNPASNTINHFHDKKRRIEYYKIKKMLADQKKGVIVTGNHEENPNDSSSEIIESTDQKKNKRDFFEKPISRILELLDITSNKEKENTQENNRKKFTINKSIKNKLQSKIDEMHEKKDVKNDNNMDNSLGSLRELNGFLEKQVMRPKIKESKENQDEEIQTLIPTEMSDIFFGEDDENKTILKKTIDNSLKKTKEIKISLENHNKDKMGSSPKEIKSLHFRKNSNSSKPAIPAKTNNFLSPKGNLTYEKTQNIKKNQLFSEKILEKFIPLENFTSKNENLLIKAQEKIQDNNFKKKKSHSITSGKEKDMKAESFFRKILEKDIKNPKFFSPEKANNEKSPEFKIPNESKMKKVEKFIKIYKNTVNLQKMPTYREQSQSQTKTSNLSNPVKENNDTLHNLSKISNSKSFSEKNTSKHRRINSMNPRNVLKKYQNEVPLEKVQEILFKNLKTPSTSGLKVHNNNTLHRKMPSDMCTPKEIPQKSRNIQSNGLLFSDNKFFNNQIMSRSQVNNKIKHFTNGTIHLSAKENVTEVKKMRNKSLESGKKNELNFLNGQMNFTSKNANTNSKKNLKETGLINNLKQANSGTRENINPGG